MKIFRLRTLTVLLAILGLRLPPTEAYPPAPHHTVFGMVRNQFGDPLDVSGGQVVLETTGGATVRTAIRSSYEPGINYRMDVPLDSGITLDLYKPTVLRPTLPFTLKVTIGQVVYLPLEMQTGTRGMGTPSKATQIDLTLGEDTDGDGLPDAWERALISLLGGGLTLADIRPGDDSDGDGMSNRNEYMAGTYAFDPADGFRLTLMQAGGGSSILEFLAIQNRTYSIEGSANLQHWTPLQFRTVPVGSQAPFLNNFRAATTRFLQVEIPAGLGGQTNRYFRAMVQ